MFLIPTDSAPGGIDGCPAFLGNSAQNGKTQEPLLNTAILFAITFGRPPCASWLSRVLGADHRSPDKGQQKRAYFKVQNMTSVQRMGR
ncbi:MAG: hypothetical protein AAGJ35_11650, partial [Myxococcota bacterium]